MSFCCTCSYCLFSHSVASNFLRPHKLQHARLPCPSLSPRVLPSSCLLTQWCHPTVPSSVVPFSSCPQCFLASGFFQWVSSSHQMATVLERQYQSLSYLPSKTMACFSGRLMSSASDQKLFCEICSAFNCSFDEFVGEKVVSPSYSSAILAPPPVSVLQWIFRFL